MNKKISKRINSRKRKKIILLGGLILLCILIISGIIYYCLQRYVNKVEANRISGDVFIGDANVSGMTVEEAVKATNKMIGQYKNAEITMKVDGNEAQATLVELGFDVKNIEKLAAQALNYGKTGNVWKRYRDIKKLNKVKKVIQPTYVVDKEVAALVIQERCMPLTVPATDATIIRQGDSFTITEEQQGGTLDIKASVKKVETFLNNDWHGKSGTVKMAAAIDMPKITKEQLSEIDDVLGSYTTYYGSGGGRVQNIETSAHLINGDVVMPGQEYSANVAMAPYTEENGYTEAGSYENGAVVQSMGGGICQVSTTLYNAVLQAELDVTQRSPHSMLVTYVEPSMDAAIAGDYLDLKFMNSTEAPIFIESVLSDGNITFNIYGKEVRDKARRIEYTSEIIERKEPEGKKFEEDAEAAIGSLITSSEGYTGITAKLWKTVYENDAEVSREEVNSSIYEAVRPIVKVGMGSDNEEAKAMMGAAIKSQDESVINAAIEEAIKATAGKTQ